MFLLSSSDFIQNQLFQKNSFKNPIKVSNSLDPDQDRQSVSPDLGKNYLQRLSTDDKSCQYQRKIYNCWKGTKYESL